MILTTCSTTVLNDVSTVYVVFKLCMCDMPFVCMSILSLYVHLLSPWLLTQSFFAFYLGERCISCLLQHISPNISDICVGGTLNITITTNQSHPHGSVFTLLINDGVCHSGGGGDGMVSCREQGGDVLQATFSYYITARNAGIATIKAHTTYYGAE